MGPDLAGRIAGVSALADPVRRALYQYVVAQDGSVSRDQVAAGAAVPHHVARFHLDRLVADGLLAVEFRRLTGRSGPGAGRPSKLYSRAAGEITVSVPERTYDLAGDLLAQAIEVSSETGVDPADALHDVAAARGREFGSACRAAAAEGEPDREAALSVLRAQGYEPRVVGPEITLANCPFHALAREHTSLVCGMNLALLTELGRALAHDAIQARLDPAPGRCCVVLTVAERPGPVPTN